MTHEAPTLNPIEQVMNSSYIVFGIAFAFTIAVVMIKYDLLSKKDWRSTTASLSRKTKFFLVIAHPDDESMFFVPTILSMTANPNVLLHVICLSTGNYDGLGKIREKELVSAVEYLGVSKSNVTILDDPKLQDGPNEQWDPKYVATTVQREMDRHSDNTQDAAILTFDAGGVSGHPNHISTFNGVQYLKSNLDNDMLVLKLHSVPLGYKYLGPIPLIFKLMKRVFSSSITTTTPIPLYAIHTNFRTSYNAMALHYSQFVWYRRLFVIFSWYTYINTLEEMQVEE